MPVARFLLAALTLLLVPRPATAQNTTDLHLWLQALATVSLSDHWRLHLEEQPRFFHDVSDTFQVITRTAVGRRLSDRLTVWAGHAWVAKPPGPGVTHEQRLWEQASITLPARRAWTPSLRIRQEQRWQDGWADSSHRLRTMARVVRPLRTNGPWSVALWDEAMFTLDRTTGGPTRGFDQNRLFGGVLYRFTPRESLEAGGMWVHTRVATGPDTTAWVPFVWLNLTY